MADENGTGLGGAGGGRVIDPSSISATVPEPSRKPRKSRSDAGKPRGPNSRTASSGPSAGTAKTKVKGSLDLSSLTGLLIGASVLLENKLEVDGVAISPAEADSFMTAAQNVARHYSVETTQRTLDWIAFLGVTASVFGTRAVAVVVAKSRNRRAAPQRSTPQVVVDNVPGANMSGGYMPSTVPGPNDEPS